jgi:hypothetical protein
MARPPNQALIAAIVLAASSRVGVTVRSSVLWYQLICWSTAESRL